MRIVRAVPFGLAVLLLAAACGDDGSPITQPQTSVAQSTVRVASINIVGLDRKLAEACADPAPAGVGPDRIVVEDIAMLDGLCALGLQERVVGLGDGAGDASVPDYLPFLNLPTVTADSSDTVVRTPAGGDWEAKFRTLGAQLRMSDRAIAVIDELRDDARRVGLGSDAAHYRVSLVREADGDAVALGTDSFAGQILDWMGADRPPAQREGTVELSGDLAAADGDVIYIGSPGYAAPEIVETDAWQALGAAKVSRQFLVDDPLWFGPGGPTAAAAVIHDVGNTIFAKS